MGKIVTEGYGPNAAVGTSLMVKTGQHGQVGPKSQFRC